MLEALLFVAERPLTRDEIAAVARVDREMVDARLGDLEVTLRDRGHPARIERRHGRARHGARRRPADRPLRRRGRGAAPDAGRARDARDHRLRPADHPRRHRAHPRRRRRLRAAGPAPSPARSWSSAAPRAPAARSCTGPASSSSSGSASTSIEDLPPLDVDVAERSRRRGPPSATAERCRRSGCRRCSRPPASRRAAGARR